VTHARIRLFLVLFVLSTAMAAQMRWRLLGPFRGGRAVGVAGVASRPDVFYFGSVGGGVWETENAGLTWMPIADQLGSIGAVAVAPSDPDVIYVGTGEADMRSQISYGDGMYRSSDGGKSWTHIGLDDTRQIGRIVVDPHDPNRVYVAALGHAYGANPERGVFRTTDGGQTWKKVLDHGPNVGAIDLSLDAHDPRTLYASLWAARRTPWIVYPAASGPGSGLFKSTDGGDTWVQLTQGLPTEGLGKIGVAVAPSDPQRVYAIVDAKLGGLYRSDNGGASWRLMDPEARIWGRGWYFEAVTVDPKNPDRLYTTNTSTYRSDDGGASFTPIKGAPGGDDYHQLWINPNDPDRMVLSSDQGVIVSVDGARTWSSWYNQPTAQLYHVAADQRFPFWVYGAQQDSGAVGNATRSNDRTISFRDWKPLCAGGESGYVAPDPLHPDILYGGTVERCDQRTNHTDQVAPKPPAGVTFRHAWTQPLVYSAADPHALYVAYQFLYKTTDGGRNWEQISPDLTREDPGVPANLDAATAANGNTTARKGVIYAVAPSPLAPDEIWAGTDDGLIQVTRDGGKSWQNVTPAAMTAWSKVSRIEASHFDGNTAYAAVDRHRLEDLAPYIYRTRDGGRSWQLITRGIPVGAYVNTVQEDPERRGLLFAATETGVYVSYDDGDAWQSLQLNLPEVSVRDLVVHGDDLVVATHGRSFWMLDDITPLRQWDAAVAQSPVALFQPQPAIEIQGGGFMGTPLPPEEPQAENPPNGAILDYQLRAAARGPVTLEILDATGSLVRMYSSATPPPKVDLNKLDIPAHWVPAPPQLGTTAGMHRFVWDLHYPPPPPKPGAADDLGPVAALFGISGGAWAAPGTYSVRLMVDGHRYTQPLRVLPDPRGSVGGGK